MSSLWDRLRRGEPLQGELVIDCHAHMGPWFNFHIADDPWAVGLVGATGTCGVDRIIVSPHAGIGPDAPYANTLVADAVRRFPNRISGYCTVNPNYPAEESIGELESHVAHGNLIAIKIHPSLHLYRADGPGYRPMWEWAQLHRTPVLVHTWEGDARCEPALLARLGKQYPDVPILLGHSGGGAAGRMQALDAAAEAPNLFLDLTGSGLPRGLLEVMVERAGADRILFGTDVPFVDIRPQLGYVLFARIPDDAKRKILGLNSKRVFGL